MAENQTSAKSFWAQLVRTSALDPAFMLPGGSNWESMSSHSFAAAHVSRVTSSLALL